MPRYDAYFLRVWRSEPGDGERWSCRLEHLPDGRHQRFGSLAELLACLEHVLGRASSTLAGTDPVGPPDATVLR
jgi:hypothetical protein